MAEPASDRLLLQRALIMLNLQRAQVFGTTIEEGNDLNGEAVSHWADAAIALVNARQSALTAFLGLGETTPRCPALERILEPLVLPAPPQTAVIPRAETLISHGFVQSTIAALHNRPDVAVTTEPVSTQLPVSANPNIDSNTANISATTAARKSRPAKGEGPTFRDYGGVETLVASPTIIKLKDGSYIEIRCDRCFGNTSWAHETFISGVRGLQSHLRQVHQDQPKLDWLLQRCNYRDVSAEEVEKIIAGELKIESVSCQSTANIGMGTEYVGGPPLKNPDKVASGGVTGDDHAAAAVANVAKTNDDSPAKKKRPGKLDPRTMHLDNCHVIVQPAGEDGDAGFIELRCDICHGNGSYGSGKLLSGVRGFKMHFHQIHKEAVSTADVLWRCRYRDISPQEVQEIRAGNVSIGFIRCEGSSRVRPKASYKNFNNSPRT